MQIPANFKNDIQGRDTNLVPVIWIGTLESNGDYVDQAAQYYLSTNEMTIAEGGINTLPILLSIPSIKESIDIEKRNYRISNVTISLSNYEYNGVRFSELVGENSLINTECRIYWKSPNTDGRLPLDIPSFPMQDDSMFQVYYGVIRRYKMTDDKITLSVEDKSQSKLHRDLPKKLGTANVPDKYKNKPIPMVYGWVPKSPLVVSYSPSFADEPVGDDTVKLMMDRGNLNYIFWKSSNASVQSFAPESPEIFFYDDYYIPITQYIEQGRFAYSYQRQFTPSDNIIEFGDIFTGIKTPIMENRIIALDVKTISDFNTLTQRSQFNSNAAFTTNSMVKYTNGIDWGHGDYGQDAAHTWPDAGSPIISGTLFKEYNDGDAWDGQSATETYAEDQGFDNDDVEHLETTSSWDESQIGFRLITPLYAGNNKIEENNVVRTIISVWMFNTQEMLEDVVEVPLILWAENQNNDMVYWPDPAGHLWMVMDGGGGLNSTDSGWWNATQTPKYIRSYLFEQNILTAGHTKGVLPFGIRTVDNEAGDNLLMGLQCIVESVNYKHYMLLKNMNELDYYGNVLGRIHPYPTSPEVIQDILINELEVDENIINLPNEYSNWKYQFTVKNTINSKKLIEDIASASPFVPRFNNMGDFKFDVIKNSYGMEDIIASKKILKDEIIKFSYSRTKVENVKTKVLFEYNWDHGNEKLMDSVNDGLGYTVNEVLPSNSPYDYSYYGLLDDTDSTLVIDDHRGKYIIDDIPDGDFPGTATAYAKWMLALNCNTHLKIKVRLPLNYLDIEVGSLISFDEVMGNAHPYNINYGAGTGTTQGEYIDKNGAYFQKTGDSNYYMGQRINGQQAFPLFICTSTSKSISYVDIEVYQLHNLTRADVKTGDILGVTDPSAWNYNSEATIDEGSAVYGYNYIVDNACPTQFHPTGDLDGDPNILDASQNFPAEPLDAFNNPIGPEGFDSDGNITTNAESGVFVVNDINDSALAINGSAWTFWNGGTDPVIYYTGNCVWTDFTKHYNLSFIARYYNIESYPQQWIDIVEWGGDSWENLANEVPQFTADFLIPLTPEIWETFSPIPFLGPNVTAEDHLDYFRFYLNFRTIPVPTFAGSVTVEFTYETIFSAGWANLQQFYAIDHDAIGHPITTPYSVTKTYNWNVEASPVLELYAPMPLITPTEWEESGGYDILDSSLTNWPPDFISSHLNVYQEPFTRELQCSVKIILNEFPDAEDFSLTWKVGLKYPS